MKPGSCTLTKPQERTISSPFYQQRQSCSFQATQGLMVPRGSTGNSRKPTLTSQGVAVPGTAPATFPLKTFLKFKCNPINILC